MRVLWRVSLRLSSHYYHREFKVKRLLVHLAASALVVLSVPAALDAQDPVLRASKGNDSVLLVGSLHTAKPRFHVLKDAQPQFELYFDSSDRLAVLPSTPEQFETMKQQGPFSLSAVMKYHEARRKREA
jgi:uncharacterized protein YbaP (TraB family)